MNPTPVPERDGIDAGVPHEFSTCDLYRHDSHLFETFVANYTSIIELAVREAVSGCDGQVFAKVRSLARRAGEQNAVPQDLIAVHLSALAALVRTKPQALVKACIRQSRLTLVKMIGELALYYRDRVVAQG